MSNENSDKETKEDVRFKNQELFNFLDRAVKYCLALALISISFMGVLAKVLSYAEQNKTLIKFSLMIAIIFVAISTIASFYYFKRYSKLVGELRKLN